MRSVAVVVDPPSFGDLAEFSEVHEWGVDEALVAEPAVDAIDPAVLHRFGRH